MILLFLKGFMETTFDNNVPELREIQLSLFTTLVKIHGFEYNRFERMREKHRKLQEKAKAKPSLIEQLLKETKFMNTVIVKQNQIFYISMIIARMMLHSFEYEENPQVIAKLEAAMSAFVKLIVKNLDRNDQALVLQTFDTIYDIVSKFGAPEDFRKTHISLRLQRFFDTKLYMCPYMVFAQLFNEKVFSKEDLKIVVPSIMGEVTDKYFRENICNLMSLISSNTTVRALYAGQRDTHRERVLSGRVWDHAPARQEEGLEGGGEVR